MTKQELKEELLKLEIKTTEFLRMMGKSERLLDSYSQDKILSKSFENFLNMIKNMKKLENEISNLNQENENLRNEIRSLILDVSKKNIKLIELEDEISK